MLLKVINVKSKESKETKLIRLNNRIFRSLYDNNFKVFNIIPPGQFYFINRQIKISINKEEISKDDISILIYQK